MIRWPSGDQSAPAIVLFSSVSKSFRGCCPSGCINQISRSPKLPLFVPKAIEKPSGETDQATALSRSLWGAPPSTEIIQMLLVWDDQALSLSTAGWAFAMNPALYASQPAGTISQVRPLFLNSSGWGTDCVSSVSTCLT